MNKIRSIRRWKKYISILLVVMMMITLVPIQAKAAAANVSIALSASTLEVGDTVTVTVSVKCDEAIGSYAMAVVYDSSIIEYVSGSGNGGGGTVNIAGYGDGAATTLRATLTFKAVSAGSTSVSTTGGEAYSWNEESMELAHAGARIEVGGGEEASTDNTLASLSVSPGTLSPAFSASTTSYKVTVNADTKDLVVSAKANDANASVSVSGNKSLKVGDNTVTITVTAESGDQKVYQIICTKPDGGTEDIEEDSEDSDTQEEDTDSEEDTEDTEDATEEDANRCYVLIEGIQYYFATEEDEVEIPADFGVTTVTCQNQKVMAFVGPKEAFTLVCLYNPEGEQVWFIYEEETGGFLAYQEITSKKLRLFIMKPADDIEIPEGYRSVDVELKGSIITGFMNEENSDILLVYGKRLNGDAGLYYYDTIENTFIRYFAVQGEEVVPVTLPKAEESTDLTELSKKIPLSYDQLFWVAVAIGAIVLILLIVCIVQAVKLKKNYVDPDTKAMMEYAVTQASGVVGQGGINLDTLDRAAKEKQDAEKSSDKSADKKINANPDMNKKQDLEDKAAQVVAKMDFEEVPTIQFTAITSRKKSEEQEDKEEDEDAKIQLIKDTDQE